MPIAEHFTSKHSQDWEINFTQCTPNGFLKYTDLCNMLQLTAGTHAELGGISFTDMQAFDQAWVLSRMRVEINTLPRWRDVVTVKTWIISLENSRSVRALEMYLGEKKIIGCETFWAVFNTATRRPEALALPDDHFDKFPKHLSTKERVKKVIFNDRMEIANKHKVVLSDLDIVNHVNNVKYLEWCLDTIEPQLILDQKMKSFDLNFMKELVLMDEVTILKSDTDRGLTFSIVKGDSACFGLAIGWEQ